MALSLTTLRDLTRFIIGASTTYGTNDDTKRFVDGAITDALLVADLDVVRAILETEGHPYRNGFLQRSDPLNDFDPLPPSIGGYGAVLVDDVIAVPLPAQEISVLRANRVETYDEGKYYDIVGNTITHNGNSAVIEFASVVRSTDKIQSPDTYAYAVIAQALSILFSKDGAEMSAASHFANEAQFRMQMVRQGVSVVPAVKAFQEGKA